MAYGYISIPYITQGNNSVSLNGPNPLTFRLTNFPTLYLAYVRVHACPTEPARTQRRGGEVRSCTFCSSLTLTWQGKKIYQYSSINWLVHPPFSSKFLRQQAVAGARASVTILLPGVEEEDSTRVSIWGCYLPGPMPRWCFCP